MQPEFLDRLNAELRAFVAEVEATAGLEIVVREDESLNTRGPWGHGMLMVHIESRSLVLVKPTNGYFPDGAVRHELLHVHRLHGQGIPRISTPVEAGFEDDALDDVLVDIDNDLEHLVIVPLELQLHPERRDHWEAVVDQVWSDSFPATNDQGRRIGGLLQWAFLRHVLPASKARPVAEAALLAVGLTVEADQFADEVIALLPDKVAVTAAVVRWFDLPAHKVVLEYLSATDGTRRRRLTG